jgi:hypothetical protein
MKLTTQPHSEADLINQLFTKAESQLKDIENAGVSFIETAIELGSALIKQKDTLRLKLGHGHFLSWLADNCPQISERTAQTYMATARKAISGGEEVSTGQLLLAYIQPEKVKDETEDPFKQSTIFQETWVQKLGNKLFQKVSKTPLNGWDKTEIEDLRYLAGEINRLLEKIGTTAKTAPGHFQEVIDL